MTTQSLSRSEHRRKRWLRLAIVVVVVAGVSALIAMRVASLRGDAPAPDLVVPAVEFETVHERPLVIYRGYTGTIAAQHRFAVAARVSGAVLTVPKREGDPVLSGDVLVRLDATELRAEVMRLKASIERLEADLVYWQAQLSRHRSLLATHAISQQALDDSERQVRSLNASLKEAQQSLTQATTRLGYTEIRAPSDGYVQAVYAQPGDLARANEPLLELLDDRALKLILALPQSDLATLKLGAPARVTTGAQHREVAAQLDRLYPALDAPTRTATAEVFLPGELTGLRPGMLATVSLQLDRIDAALTVPVHAIHSREGIDAVFVLENDTARWRPVRTGYTVGQRIQIVDGLAPGSSVIVTPDSRLTDGMVVSARHRVAAQ